MPRKKRIAKKSWDLKQKIHWGESYTSLILGITVVIVATILVLLFSKHRPIKDVSSTRTENLAKAEQAETKDSDLIQKYTIKPGDDLWSISERIYKSGYNWVDIARANNLEDPGLIFEGMVLKIPNVPPKILLAKADNLQTFMYGKAITADTYIVEKDDNLWGIAVRAYGDGFRWVDIAKANNLENPDLIFSGSTLKIPR